MGHSVGIGVLQFRSISALGPVIRQGLKLNEIHASEIHALSQEVRWINGDVRTVEISPVPSFMKTQVITNGLGALRPITLSSLEGGGEENGDHCYVSRLQLSSSISKRSAKYRSPEQKRLIISYRWGTTRDILRQTYLRVYQRGHGPSVFRCEIYRTLPPQFT